MQFQKIIRLFILTGCCFFIHIKYSTAQLSAGIRAAFQLSRFSNTNLGEIQWKPSFHAGIYGNYAGKKKMSFEAGFLYSRQGGLLKTDEPVKYQLNLLQLPLTLQYRFRPGLQFETGLQAGYALAQKITDGTTSVSTAWYFKKGDLSWLAGISGFVPAYHTGVSLRFSQSLLNNGRHTSPGIYHSVVSLGLYYRLLPLSKLK